MLIFRQNSIRVYACILPERGEDRGGASRAGLEREGVSRILHEAFPGDVPQVGHHASGAPFLVGRRESVSISHCRGLAVVAVGDDGSAVGIDAENCGRGVQLNRVKSRFLSDAQAPWGANDGLLLRGWTIKEALYKVADIAGWPLCGIPLPAVEFGGDSWPADEPAVVEVPGKGRVRIRKIFFTPFEGSITLVSF